MSAAVGFACHWGPDPRATWSGTPYALRRAMRELTTVHDLDLTLPRAVQLSLKALSARRSGGAWHAKWRHSPAGVAAVERNLRRAARRDDADIVVEIGDLGHLEGRYAVVQDLSYDLLLEHFGAGGVPHFRSLTRRRIMALRDRQLRIYRDAHRLLPMSDWLARRCVESGVSAERVQVVNPGINAPLDPAAPVPERRRERTRRLLFVGRDFETKAGDQVVAAFVLLRAELGAGIALTVAGPRTWPLPGRPADGIDFVGPVPAAGVQALYDTHDLFVMPSRFEGFGIAFAEALVRGLPCVGRNACAMPEIITPGDGGLLVDREDPAELAETILRALDDDGLYERCAAAVPRRREHFTWRRAAEQTLTALGLLSNGVMT